MPQFAYRGRGTGGELLTGKLEAADASAAADQLASRGVTPLEIEASNDPTGASGGNRTRRLFQPRVGLLDVMLFSRQMYTLLKSGVPILRALGGLQESATNPTLREVIGDLRTSLDAGRELSTAMRSHPGVFSPFYVSLVRVGEATGELEHAFDRLFAYLEFEREVRERIKTALRYPLIVLAVIAVAIGVVNFFVIPVFAQIFAASKVPLPLVTQILIGTSNWFLAYWWLLAGAVAGSVLAFVSVTRTPHGRMAWDRAKLRIPVAGPIIRKATLSRFARSFSIATRAGVPIVQALSVVGGVVDNAFIASRIERMRDGMERGEGIARNAAAAGVFTPVVLQMIAVGEETGELDELMGEVADMYDREVEYEIKNLSASVEPIITVALGVLVLILALGIFLPMWQMGSVMLKK